MSTSPRGLRNSSITRVRPVFRALIDRDPEGKGWLPELLSLAPEGDRLPADVRAQPGALFANVSERRRYRDRILDYEIELERCFEAEVPPSAAFLEWLLRHPNRLAWPERVGGGNTTRHRREQLKGMHGREAQAEAQAEGLRALSGEGATGSRRKWWAFEGFTSVDCLLETDTLVLFIEGKRNEPLSKATDWYPARNQLVRNLEVARGVAGARVAAVMLACEDGLDVDHEQWIAEGTPHLGEIERSVLAESYMGQVTWSELCDGLGVAYSDLPDTIEDVPRGERAGPAGSLE
jgi:hypothetical protein